MSMDDYFALAGYNSLAQGIMGRAKLEGSTKFWWKLHLRNPWDGRTSQDSQKTPTPRHYAVEVGMHQHGLNHGLTKSGGEF